MPLYNIIPDLRVSAISPNGLLAEYRFDALAAQQLIDYSGNSRNGILGTSPDNLSQDPVPLDWLNAGLSFNASLNQFISLPAYTFFSGDFYVEFVFLSRSNQPYSRLIDCDNVTGTSYYGLVVGPSFNNNCPFVGLNGTNIQSSIEAQLNKFHHLAVQLAENTVSIFLNRLLIARADFPTPSGARNYTLIGKSNYTGGNYFDGIIAQCNIYNRTLSTVERINNFLAIKERLEPMGILLS